MLEPTLKLNKTQLDALIDAGETIIGDFTNYNFRLKVSGTSHYNKNLKFWVEINDLSLLYDEDFEKAKIRTERSKQVTNALFRIGVQRADVVDEPFEDFEQY